MRFQTESPPPFKSYFATKADLDGNQRHFYDSWCAQWKQGIAAPVLPTRDGRMGFGSVAEHDEYMYHAARPSAPCSW